MGNSKLNIVEELLNIKSELEELKIEKAHLEGKKLSYLETLKKEYDCDTLVQAEKLYKKNELKLKSTEEEIEKKFEEIRSEYEN